MAHINGNSIPKDFFDEIIRNSSRELDEMIRNASTNRADILRFLLDPRRDIESECGYPGLDEQIPASAYAQLYDRDFAARRVVEIFPKECFQVTPSVYENDDDTETEFEKSWDSLGAQLEETANAGFLDNGEDQEGYFKDEQGSILWDYLLRADILSGIGTYGVIFLGLDDGEEDLTKPVKPKKGTKLNYIRVFSEENVQITSYNQDPTSPRYQFPQMYALTINDYRNLPTNSVGAPQSTLAVHWSRIIHLCDNRSSNEIFGTPRIKPVINNVLGLRKLVCGSPEMFWKGAFYGISLETHPQLGGNPKIDRAGLKSQMEQYINGLQRQIITSGMSAKTLSPNVADPASHIQKQLDAIAIALNCPMRIFMGAERGELASSQDDAAWNDRIKLRQNTYITPRVIVPLVNRLIQIGVLPKPKKGFRVYWPDITSQSGQEKYQVASAMIQTIATYSQSEETVRKILTPYDFYVEVMKFDDETAKKILDNAQEELQEIQEEQAAQAGTGEGMGGIPPELASLLGMGSDAAAPPQIPQTPGIPNEEPIQNRSLKKYNVFTKDLKGAILIANTLIKTDRELAEEIVANCMEGENEGKPGPCPENRVDNPNSGNTNDIKTSKGFSVVGVLKKLLGIGGKTQTEIDAENLIKPQLEKPFKDKLADALKQPVSRVIPGSGLPVLKIDNKEYVLKQNDRFSESEVLGSKYAKLAGITIPKVEPHIINGVKMNTVEHLPEGYKTVFDLPKEEKVKTILSVEKPELEKHALYSYLIGHTDPNDKNFLISDGKMAAIDTDPAFSLGADGSARYVRPLFLRHIGDTDFTFSKEEIEKMIDVGTTISKSLKADGKEKDAKGVDIRTGVLRELIRLHGNSPTVKDLIQLGMGTDVKNGYTNKRGIQYFFKG